MVSVTLKADQRAAFVGKTGSGKTFFAEYVSQDIARFAAFDPKPSLGKWPNLETVTTHNHAAIRALRRGENRRIRITGSYDMDGWIPWLDLMWQIGNITIYIDEVNLIIPPRRGAPHSFTRLYQQGRERGIGVWAAMQRPVNVPPVCLTEAEWLFLFRVSRPQDRKYVAGYGDEYGKMEQPIRDDHGFWTFNQTWRNPVYTPRLIKSTVDASATQTRVQLPAQRVG